MKRLTVLCVWAACALTLRPCIGSEPKPVVDASAPPPCAMKVVRATPAPELDALFEQSEGWIGGDGAFTAALSPNRSVWIFGDTWVGAIKDGERTGDTIVSNSAAVMEGRDANARVQFAIRQKPDGSHAALIEPQDGKGWFWIFGSALVGDRLYLFMTQTEKTSKGAFGFRLVRKVLGIVSNPHDNPLDWRIDQVEIPHTIFNDSRNLCFGSGVYLDDDYLYIYGTDESMQKWNLFRDRYLIVARAPRESIADFSTWEFFNQDQGGTWVDDFLQVSHMANEMGSELSVSYLKAINQYVLVYSRSAMSAEIRARTAPNPWGPWSEPITIYRCPEMNVFERTFTYAAKAHWFLGSDDELVVTYFSNASDLRKVAENPHIYMPRFVRVKVAPND